MKIYLPLPLKDIAFVLFTKAKIYGLLTSPLMALDEDNRLLEMRSQMLRH